MTDLAVRALGPSMTTATLKPLPRSAMAATERSLHLGKPARRCGAAAALSHG